MTTPPASPSSVSPQAAAPADSWLDAEAPPRLVTGHGWSMTIDGSHFDDVAWHGTPVLRGLRFVVRDHDWRTPPAVVHGLDVVEQGDTTTVRMHVRHEALGCGYESEALVTLADGELRFEVTGRATTAFRRNRIGVVALHSGELAGAGLTVTHPSGKETDTVFPTEIAPHQPARDIAGLTWAFRGGRARLVFAGDVFEMEDQRNWTDASFKTYSTPLSQPFPVAVSPGDTLRQSVTLSVGAEDSVSTDSSQPVGGDPEGDDEARAGDTGVSAACQAPTLAVGASTAEGVSQPSPSWLRGTDVVVELDATGEAWSRVLTRARSDAAGGALDVRILADAPSQIDAVVHGLCGVPVVRLAVFDISTHVTTPALHERLVRLAAAEPVTGDLISGTRAHFTELNRNRASLAGFEGGVAFSITPQMHDTSRRQVVDSLAQQRVVAVQAVSIAAGRPVHVGPVTLRARFNAVATSPRPTTSADVVADGCGANGVWNATDARQGSPAYAAWLLASYRALAVPGVESIAYAEAWGPRGFGTAAGVPSPAAEVLRWLTALAGSELLEAPYDPLVPVVVARRGAVTTVLAANLTDEPVVVDAARASLALAPLEVARRLV